VAETTNAVAQLRAYDQLPPKLREILRTSPFKLSAVAVLSAYQGYGCEATARMLTDNINQMLAMAEQEWQ